MKNNILKTRELTLVFLFKKAFGIGFANGMLISIKVF